MEKTIERMTGIAWRVNTIEIQKMKGSRKAKVIKECLLRTERETPPPPPRKKGR